MRPVIINVFLFKINGVLVSWDLNLLMIYRGLGQGSVIRLLPGTHAFYCLHDTGVITSILADCKLSNFSNFFI